MTIMHHNYKAIICELFLFILAISCAHNPSTYQLNKPKMYTAYNMWYEKPDNMECVNYRRGTLLPAGTEVKEINVISSIPESEINRVPYLNITFEVVSTGQRHKVIYREGFHGNRKITDYANLMFTEKTFEELTEGMSTKEIDAIKSGVVVNGMSKKAVIVTIGLPADRQTPDLRSNNWIHMTSRFHIERTCFSSEDISIDCSELSKDELLQYKPF